MIQITINVNAIINVLVSSLSAEQTLKKCAYEIN